MMGPQSLIDIAEASVRSDTGIVWDFHDGHAGQLYEYEPGDQEMLLATCGKAEDADALPGMRTASAMTPTCGRDIAHGQGRQPSRRTQGAAFVYDGTLEGMFTAIHAAFVAHDAEADIIEETHLQPRLGQEVVAAHTNMDAALKVRRLVEYSLGAQAFRTIRTAASTEDPARGTAIHRFLRYAFRESGRMGCSSCSKKTMCTHACSAPDSCSILDDISRPVVRDVVTLYRSVVNERHLMLQFMRFEHCEGDVWFARCNPKANVVPLLMDWFIPRFNDQKFVIYDENHAMSGVYDGQHWYLVRGDAVTPPPHMEDERMMRDAWQRFYRAIGVESRYNPELRRSFMPMRLWRNLPELG